MSRRTLSVLLFLLGAALMLALWFLIQFGPALICYAVGLFIAVEFALPLSRRMI